MYIIDWESLRDMRPLVEGDRVHAKALDAACAPLLLTTITLSLAAGLRSWKAVQLLTGANEEVALVTTDLRTRMQSITLDAAAAARLKTAGRLVLWKSKELGIHRPTYVMPEVHRLLYRDVRFTWVED